MLLLPQLPLRSPERQRPRRKEQVRLDLRCISDGAKDEQADPQTLHRCARNCFQCPQCDHSLSVVASDPDPSIPLSSAAASVGEPPYLLSCNFCGWDSKQVGMTFEKPTGLAREFTDPSQDCTWTVTS